MTKAEAVKLIDDHKNKMISPNEMLKWTWLRVIVNEVSQEAWDEATQKAVEVLSQ